MSPQRWFAFAEVTMRVENIRIWQWMLIGAFVGLLFAAVKSYQGPWFDSDEVETLDQARFEREMVNVPDPIRRLRLAEQKYQKDPPYLKDVVVSAPLGGDGSGPWWISGKFYTVIRRMKDPNEPKSPVWEYGDWLPFKYPAKVPYHANTSVIGTYPTVLDYLKVVRQHNPKMVAFQYDWPHRGATPYWMLSAAGVCFIGLAWPATLALMQNAGLARKREQRVKLAPNRSLDKPAGPIVDEAAVKAQLDNLNADLEASLGAFGAGGVSATPAAATEVIPHRTPALSAGVSATIDGSPTAAEVDDADKEYGGEFYPVVKTSGHKD